MVSKKRRRADLYLIGLRKHSKDFAWTLHNAEELRTDVLLETLKNFRESVEFAEKLLYKSATKKHKGCYCDFRDPGPGCDYPGCARVAYLRRRETELQKEEEEGQCIECGADLKDGEAPCDNCDAPDDEEEE